MQTKKQISITLDASILKETQKLAQAADRTLSGYINMVLKMHMDQETHTKNDI